MNTFALRLALLAAVSLTPASFGAAMASPSEVRARAGLAEPQASADKYRQVRPLAALMKNTASGVGATIGGGASNLASGNYSTISGGLQNQATAQSSTVAGGRNNLASAHDGFVAGSYNVAAGDATAVSGGVGNRADGWVSTIGGGIENATHGWASTVSGGELNCAGGWYSWAGGFRAKVRPGASAPYPCNGIGNGPTSQGDRGTFIWADSQNSNFVSSGPNQFLVRANGGIWLGRTSSVSLPSGRFINTSTGAFLSNGGVWTNSSSRALKNDFAEVDPEDILDRLLDLPLSTWRYADSPDEGRHLGPMAEDFHARFGLGIGGASIGTVDANGVALAAVQGLNARLEARIQGMAAEQHREREAQRAELEAMRAELAQLRALVAPAVVHHLR